MLAGGTPARGHGALRGNCALVGIEFTVATDVVTVVSGKGAAGFSISNFTTGTATLTFPRSLAFLFPIAAINANNDTPGSRSNLEVREVDLAAGTALIKVWDAASGALEAAPNGTYKLLLAVGE